MEKPDLSKYFCPNESYPNYDVRGQKNVTYKHLGLKEPLSFQTQKRKWYHRTPAMMAAGITDHKWTIMELLRYPMVSN